MWFKWEMGLKSNVIIELKVIFVMGLHRGRKKEVDKKIDFNSLKALDNELKNKSDNDILKMDYCYFCSEKGKYQFVLSKVEKLKYLDIELESKRLFKDEKLTIHFDRSIYP